MLFDAISYNDLNVIKKLQPDGWPDIVPIFEFYINSNYCFPIKTMIGNQIAGIGVSIVYGKTCWLAHIIVDINFRKRGIGSEIVAELLKNLQNYSIKTYLLIATEIGFPIYIKAGFKAIEEYAYFKREKPCVDKKASDKVFLFEEKYRSRILNLDKKISGEDRKILISDSLSNSFVYIDKSEILGIYIPNLGEGLIEAETNDAGLELMKIKYSKNDKAVIPSSNIVGINLLKENNFVLTQTKGTRMYMGNRINWHPEKIYSRIGGNFG